MIFRVLTLGARRRISFAVPRASGAGSGRDAKERTVHFPRLERATGGTPAATEPANTIPDLAGGRNDVCCFDDCPCPPTVHPPSADRADDRRTPDGSSEPQDEEERNVQCMEALARANKVRLARAALKREIGAGRRSVTEVIMASPGRPRA